MSGMSSREACQQKADERSAMALVINKMSEEGAWDSMRARDVPEEIVNHVMAEIDTGTPMSEIRKGLGIRSSSAKEWGKIVAALKMGYRINAPTFFHRLYTRQERMATKLEKVIDVILDDDVEALKEVDPDTGVSKLRTWSKDITGLIDSYNRLTQGIIKNGKELGVFAETGGEGKGSGTTIIVKSNITLKAPEKPQPKTVEVSRVGQEKLPK